MGARSRGAFLRELAGAGPALVLAALALGAGGCFFGDIDYDGKSCTGDARCPSGWTCASHVCRRNESSCAFQPDNVRIAWTTPHAIRWEWDPPDNLAGFGSYRLRVGRGSGPEDDAEPRLIDADDNPELGFASIPRTEGDDLVRGTISGAHEDAALHWGRLEAVDNGGCVWSSPTLSATTALMPLSNQKPLVVFADELVDWAAPKTMVVVPDEETSADGTAHLSWTAPADDSEGNNMHLGLSYPLAALGPAVQDTAYIEAFVALDSDNDSFWSRIALARADGDQHHSLFEPFALRADGTYQSVEIPLRALVPNDGVRLSSDHTLVKFMFGCSPFEPGTTLRIDEVRIRW